jgi:Ca2+-binding EF-hand superfamily protein
MFSPKQIQDYQDSFNFMDMDKDGVISKGDLRATYDAMGRMADEKNLDELLNEATGPLNFQGLLALIAARMSGSADDDDVVVNAFKSFDDNGKIDSEKLRHALMTWGAKFTSDEVDDIYGEMTIDGSGKIETNKVIEMLTGGVEEEEEE